MTSEMRQRFFVIGTDTEVGKTTVSVALLKAAAAAGLPLLPFKPAVSGDLSDSSDHARLARAVPELGLNGEAISVHRYEAAIAPGMAEPNHPFFEAQAEPASTSSRAIRAARNALDALEERTETVATLIEGAGGLHVPMPGGTWLAEWIEAFDAQVIVVGRAGLGTLNHTILTVEALRTLGRPPALFFLCCTQPDDLGLANDNRRVLEARLGIPCAGILPHRPDPDTHDPSPRWLRADLFASLGLER